MRINALNNKEAISELGILTSAYLKLQKIPVQANDPLAAYQHRILNWNGSFSAYVDMAAEEIGQRVRMGSKLKKVVFAGYESMLIDKVTNILDSKLKIVVIPNSLNVDFRRMALNHSSSGNVTVQEIYQVWESTGHETIVFVPYFELADHSVWVYRYSAPIINDQLFSKARAIIGVNILSDIQIEAGYAADGSLSLLSETNPYVFQNIISVEPKILLHELDNVTHSA